MEPWKPVQCCSRLPCKETQKYHVWRRSHCLPEILSAPPISATTNSNVAQPLVGCFKSAGDDGNFFPRRALCRPKSPHLLSHPTIRVRHHLNWHSHMSIQSALIYIFCFFTSCNMTGNNTDCTVGYRSTRRWCALTVLKRYNNAK